ncbi:MAG: tripartite tricarboxylate transporter substrate binding protein [Betaproteobacteria bacterium]|nr:tripartite tricarboxylate transporter substrate binding protein [Betaproteobacteria bacterium]
MLLIARTVLAAMILAGAFTAFAQSNYPNKPITWIVPYPAGGNADLRTREIARLLAPMLGQPIIAENRSGAGGNIGTAIIAKAKPDGYTIGVGNFAPLAVNQTMMKSIPFDPLGDFSAIILIERGPLVLMVNNASPIQSLADLIATAKAKPGKLTFASGGLGGSHHLSAELLKATAKIDLVHIPYKGGAPAATDLLAGHVDMMFEQMYAAMPNIKAGKTRALGITSKKRLPFAPDIPTMEEAGLPGFEVLNWQGVIAPRGTSPEIIQKLNADLNKILATDEMRDRVTSQGNEIAGGTPQQFDAFIRAENAKWGKLVREAKITAD